MGSAVGRAAEAVWEWVEYKIDTAFVQIDIAARWALGDIPEEVVRVIYQSFEKTAEFLQRLGEATETGEVVMDGYCVDEDGLHFIQEEWSPPGTCRFRKCVAHDTIKEMRCPNIPKLDHRCSIKRGELSEGWPDCCDSVVCPMDKQAPILQRPAEKYWRYQNYRFIFM